MRRRTLRPSSQRAIVFIAVVLGFLYWVCWEVGRSRIGRALLLAASGSVFLFFALGWVAK